MIDEKKLIEKLNKNSIFRGITNCEGKNIYDMISDLLKAENTDEFKHFKLHSVGTLDNMSKKQLVDYIHVLYNNWNSADEQYNNVMGYAKKLQDEVDYYKHEYFSECDRSEELVEKLNEIETPKSYEFDDLHENMLVFVTSIDDVIRIIEINEKEIVCEMIGNEVPTIVYYKENRFYPITKSMEVKEN